MKSKRILQLIITILISASAVFVALYAFLYYLASKELEARDLCTSIIAAGWEELITYDMLSKELKEIITEEEFLDSSDENRYEMYKKLENLIVDDRPLKNFDGSTHHWKTPGVDRLIIDGEYVYAEIRIDVENRCGKPEVRNFCTYFY